MNLVIDIGNTFAKVAVFQGDLLLEVEKTTAEKLFSVVEKKIEKFLVTHSVLFSVSQKTDAVVALLSQKTIFIQMSNQLTFPFVNTYATPNTLGQDRVALIAAAAYQYPNQNVLVIDAGTCVTYDLLTANGAYLGGAISPGLQMRFKALHTFTAKLPVIEVKDIDYLIGDSTESSILSGVINGLVYEVDGFVSEYSTEYKDLTVILTGGDALFLSKRFKNGIFANSNFLLEGLNVILEHNKRND